MAANLLRDALRGVIDPSPEVTWVALGAGSDVPTDGDTILQDERFRKQVTAQSALGTWQLLTTVYVAEGEANDFIISEVGWFAGDATAAAVVVPSGAVHDGQGYIMIVPGV